MSQAVKTFEKRVEVLTQAQYSATRDGLKLRRWRLGVPGHFSAWNVVKPGTGDVAGWPRVIVNK